MTCIDYYGERTSTCHKSPYLPCKLLTSLIELDHCYWNFYTQTNNGMMTSCRTQAYISKELNKGIIYLSISDPSCKENNCGLWYTYSWRLGELNFERESEIKERSTNRIKVSGGNVYLWGQEEGPRRWMHHGRPPVWVRTKDTLIIYIVTKTLTSHIWPFEICIVWMV